MTDPKNIAHDKKLLKEKKKEQKHAGIDRKGGTQPMAQPGKKQRIDPSRDGHGHGPDADEALDKTESGIEP
jgi:hypothetical protein